MADSQDKKITTKGMNKELGDSGTLIYQGIITQEEYNSKLKNLLSAIKIYDTMRRSDATVRSTLQVCKLPILAAEWSIEAASDDESDQYIARFIQRELFNRNVDFHQFMKEGLNMFDFGFSIAEKMYQATEFEGQFRIGIEKLSYRKQKSLLTWEMENGQEGIQQQLVDRVVNIPMQKLIVFTNDKEGENYEGISLLRYAYKHWDIKDKLDIVNAIALEKLAVGVPILKKPSDADPQELEDARDAMRNFRANEEGYQEIPVGWEMEMLDMKANSTKDVLPTVQYHDRQIQISVLAQFLSLGGTEASGSRALSSDHSKLFLLSEEATAKNVQSTLQEQLIKQLCDINFSNLPNGYPKLKFSKIGDEDATALATNVQNLMNAGAITYDPELEDHIRKVLHLPDLPEDIRKQYEEDLKTIQDHKKKKAENLEGKPEGKSEGKKTPDSNIDDEDEKNIEASAIAKAKRARRELIDIIVQD